MRARGLFIAGLVVLILGSVGVAPTRAQRERRCTAEFNITLSPGFSERSSGVFHSGGESGRIDCEGRRGSFGVDGRHGTKDPDGCTSGGEGWLVHSFTFQGGENVKNTATFTFGGLSGGFLNGTIEGERLSGTFRFTPTEGDCFTTPVTKGSVRIEGSLKS